MLLPAKPGSREIIQGNRFGLNIPVWASFKVELEGSVCVCGGGGGGGGRGRGGERGGREGGRGGGAAWVDGKAGGEGKGGVPGGGGLHKNKKRQRSTGSVEKNRTIDT